MVDDRDGGAERVVVKSPGAAVRVEISSSTGVINIYHDGSQDPLVSRSRYKLPDAPWQTAKAQHHSHSDNLCSKHATARP
jgi:hypothetical protein